MTQNMNYSIVTGSRAYGLHNEKSDKDMLSVWTAPLEDRLKLYGKPKEVCHSDVAGVDVKEYELEKFFTMTFMKPSVNAIEFLYTNEVYITTPLFEYIREHRALILHQMQWKSMKGQMLNMLDSAQKHLDKNNPSAAGKETASAMRVYQIASDIHGGLDPVINLEKGLPNFCSLLRKVKFNETSKELQGRVTSLSERIQDELPIKQEYWKEMPREIDKDAVNKLFIDCINKFDVNGDKLATIKSRFYKA